jgi:hypothetical protein
MTIEAGEPIQVRKCANGFIITPASGEEFVSDAVTLVFADEVGVTKWMIEHFAPPYLAALEHAMPTRPANWEPLTI